MSANRRWPRLVIAILVIAALYGCWGSEPASYDDSYLAHFLHRFLFGWIKFAERVFPEVNIAFAPVAFALLVAALTWALLYFAGKRWWGWSWRTPLVLVCAPALCFAIVLASAGIQTRVPEIAANPRLHTYSWPHYPPSAIFKVKFDEPKRNEQNRP